MMNFLVAFSFLLLMNQVIFSISGAITGMDLRLLADQDANFRMLSLLACIIADIGIINALSSIKKSDDNIED